MTMVKVNNGDLYYEKTGSGEALILLHCGFFDTRNWKKQVGPFSEKFMVVNYDQRGSGQSSVPVSPFSHVEDLLQLMDALKIEKANLVAHSIGAQIAIDFTELHPERVKKLVVLAPVLSGYQWSKEYQAWFGDFLSDLRPEVMTEKIVSAPNVAVTLGDKETYNLVKSAVLHNTSKLLTWKSSEIHWPTPSGIERLAEIKVPTLVLSGDVESPDILNIVKTLTETISKVQSRSFTGCDHMLNLHSAAEFNKSVIQFLA